MCRDRGLLWDTSLRPERVNPVAAQHRTGNGRWQATYRTGWKRQHGPASDLDLAVLLINSLDNLEDPPDRLTSVDWFRSVTAQAGRGELTAGLGEGDLGGLRELRDCLRAVFLAGSADEAAALLNPALVRAGAVAQLVITPDGPALEVAPGEQGLAALAARLPAALASHLAQRGMGRLGTCAAGEFLAEAIELADHGAVSLLPQGIFPWVAAPHGNRKDVTAIRRQLAALQASLNYLTSRSYVDKSRVAIAGHDYGAMYGALLASSNRVVHAAVLAAPDATWGHWFVKYWLGFTGHKAAAYKAIFAGLQPVGHVARLGRHELFQWAGQDIFVSARVRQEFAQHAPHARVKLYPDADHQMTDQAQADRDAFLTRELGLS